MQKSSEADGDAVDPTRPDDASLCRFGTPERVATNAASAGNPAGSDNSSGRVAFSAFADDTLIAEARATMRPGQSRTNRLSFLPQKSEGFPGECDASTVPVRATHRKTVEVMNEQKPSASDEYGPNGRILRKLQSKRNSVFSSEKPPYNVHYGFVKALRQNSAEWVRNEGNFCTEQIEAYIDIAVQTLCRPPSIGDSFRANRVSRNYKSPCSYLPG